MQRRQGFKVFWHLWKDVQSVYSLIWFIFLDNECNVGLFIFDLFHYYFHVHIYIYIHKDRVNAGKNLWNYLIDKPISYLAKDWRRLYLDKPYTKCSFYAAAFISDCCGYVNSCTFIVMSSFNMQCRFHISHVCT